MPTQSPSVQLAIQLQKANLWESWLCQYLVWHLELFKDDQKSENHFRYVQMTPRDLFFRDLLETVIIVFYFLNACDNENACNLYYFLFSFNLFM